MRGVTRYKPLDYGNVAFLDYLAITSFWGGSLMSLRSSGVIHLKAIAFGLTKGSTLEPWPLFPSTGSFVGVGLI